MINEKRGEIAWKLDQTIKENEEQRRFLLVENARLLSEIYDNQYYKDLLGFEDAEWGGYLGDIEVYYSRNQINTYIKVYKKLVRELAILSSTWDSLPITRLADCSSLLTAENAEEWFAKISVLTSKDWQIELRKARGQLTEDDDHTHDMVEYDVCRKCGLKIKHTHDSGTTS